MKTFTIAGTSNLNGVIKLRVANGSVARRVAVLKTSGHTDIKLQELPEPMTRQQAAAFLNIEGVGLTARQPAINSSVSVERTADELDVVVDLADAE